jgi:hypothetical protein
MIFEIPFRETAKETALGVIKFDQVMRMNDALFEQLVNYVMSVQISCFELVQ